MHSWGRILIYFIPSQHFRSSHTGTSLEIELGRQVSLMSINDIFIDENNEREK